MGGILAVFVGCVPAEVLRAPGWGVSGWLSRKVMENVNSLSSVDLVEELLSGTIRAYYHPESGCF